MAKARRSKSQGSAPSRFWKPEKIGETITGVFGGFVASEPRPGQTAISMKLDDMYVSVSAVMYGFIHPVALKLKPGKDRFKVQYIGETEKKKKNQNAARLFRVWLNGKELVSEGAPVRPASKEDLTKFFVPI